MDEEKKEEREDDFKKPEEENYTKPVEENDKELVKEEDKKPVEDNYKTPEEPHKELSKSNPSLTGKLRANPFMLSTIVLGVLSMFLLISMTSGGMTGNVVSEEVAGENVLDFASSQLTDMEILNVEKESGLYKVDYSSSESDGVIYVTLDGKNLISGLIPLIVEEDDEESSSNTQEIPKSDKPEVELFVMSYCPYGTQAEKGILPVVALLGDKIDFKLRAVHYILHGEKEDVENKRQLCIREEQGQDKLNKYLVCILDSDNPQEPADVSACEQEVGIDSSNLQDCMDNRADGYFESDSALSEGYGVQGSPTLVINGEIISSSRSPAAYLETICSAFNDAPQECSEEVSTANPSTGFGYKEGTDTVAQC